MGKFTSNVLYM